MVSVLLDAGAGNKWSYKSKESGKIYSRSEGLAVASLEMFKSGLFSSDPTEPCQVDGAGLKKVTVEKLAKGMQHSEQNPLAGIEGRTGLLVRLADALNHQDFFGVDARPGNMLGKIELCILFRAPADFSSRLPSLSPFDACFIRSHCPYHHSMDGPYGRPLINLARVTNTNRRRGYRRCMGMLESPAIPARATVGEYYALP